MPIQLRVALIALPWLALGAGSAAAEPPALLSRQGELGVRTAAGERVATRLADGVGLHAVAPLPGDGWIAAGVRDGSTLVLLRDGAGGGSAEGAVERIPAPESRGRLAASPVPLIAGERGGLLGIAWLGGESPRSLEVRFAPALGPGDWGETETVAGPGPGSQLALSGGVLADGSAMLVWSAFDGEDDEILWSHREAGRWSAPAPLGGGNRVPDITPVVAPLGDGAVAAWSRFDGGEYRLVLSRWTGNGWSAAEPAGPPGSLYPTVLPHEEGALLGYRDARRGAWTALRLDPAGRVTARASLPASEPGIDPVLLGASEDGVRFLVPGTSEPARAPWHPLP